MPSPPLPDLSPEPDPFAPSVLLLRREEKKLDPPEVLVFDPDPPTSFPSDAGVPFFPSLCFFGVEGDF